MSLLFVGQASVLGRKLVADVTTTSVLLAGQQLDGSRLSDALTIELVLLSLLLLTKSLRSIAPSSDRFYVPTRHKIGHFRETFFSSQSLGLVLKNVSEQGLTSH